MLKRADFLDTPESKISMNKKKNQRECPTLEQTQFSKQNNFLLIGYINRNHLSWELINGQTKLNLFSMI